MADSTAAHDVASLIAAGRDREAAQRGAGLDIHDGGPMDPLAQFEQLGPVLGPVVLGIRADQLDEPTPAGMTVRGVLEHMIGGGTAFAALYRGETPPDPDLAEPVAGCARMLGALAEAIGAPGALERTIPAPFGEVDGETFARFVVLDGLVHGWDVATATGQAYDPPPALVAAVDAFAHQALDPLRDGDTFKAAVEPAPGATPIEKLAAYTGRTNPKDT